MIDYQGRLVAALKARGANDAVVRDARASIAEFQLDEDGLVNEFGEPEDYARALMPGAEPKARYAFVAVGLVLTVVAWLGLRAAQDAGWEPVASLGPFALLLALVFVVLGIVAEFVRYLRRR